MLVHLLIYFRYCSIIVNHRLRQKYEGQCMLVGRINRYKEWSLPLRSGDCLGLCTDHQYREQNVTITCLPRGLDRGNT
jgi:hypothetical protein